MELLDRRKAFSLISRNAFRSLSNLSSSPSGKASTEPPSLGDFPSQSFSTPLPSGRKLLPAIQSSARRCPGIYRTFDSYPENQQSTFFCYRRFSDGGCPSGSLHILARNCSSTAYASSAPPRKFRGSDRGTVNVEDPQGMAAMEGADDLNMPPYDDADYAEEDDEEYEEEQPPPDPEEKLLYSPSDED